MQYKAILFDLDGTLLDTLADLGNSMNRVLRSQGFPEHPLDAYRYFVGNGIRMLVTRTLPETVRDEKTLKRCLSLFLQEYDQHWKDETRPYDGVPEMLDALQTRGLKLAVFSNKPHDFTLLCVQELLSQWRFHAIAGQRETIPPKPDPGGALEIARTLNLSPSEFLYLGDTGTDMQTAVAAGMFPVGALWGFRPREELVEHGAQTLLEHPIDILELLK
ncbi:putative phosphoglycolate phosphatase, bacterial [Candidatus Vecturithrix granuli]|uniref:Putative phosphoglycolate phosphatase, bacterial n=1 Tax=Vecturithrix granuli TaxID=1499967 RepID=A0A0S6WAC1_VECG1|nr:putative phosphoglycolate phosphatase, bacterial [Candidatus Vecturithrix granuli]